MLLDIEMELEDSCDCIERALDITREFFPQDKELYAAIINVRDHARHVSAIITKKESEVASK